MSRVTPLRPARRAARRDAARHDARAPRREARTARRRESGPRPSRARSQPRRGLSFGILRHIFSGWFAGKLLAVALIGGVLWALAEGAEATEFHVAEVVLAGNALIPTEELLADLPAVGENIFFIRGARLERRLRANPAIGQAKVGLRLPNSLQITVQERAPAVVWDTGSRQLLADADGRVLRDALMAIEPAASLPVLKAPEGPEAEPGGQLDPEAVRVAQSLVARLDGLGLTGSWLEYRPVAGVTIVSPSSHRVAVGFTDRLDAKLAAYLAIRARLDQNAAKAELVDVRFLDRPYYR